MAGQLWYNSIVRCESSGSEARPLHLSQPASYKTGKAGWPGMMTLRIAGSLTTENATSPGTRSESRRE